MPRNLIVLVVVHALQNVDLASLFLELNSGRPRGGQFENTHIRPVYVTHGPESRPDGAAPRCAIEIKDKQATVVHLRGADAYADDTMMNIPVLLRTAVEDEGCLPRAILAQR